MRDLEHRKQCSIENSIQYTELTKTKITMARQYVFITFWLMLSAIGLASALSGNKDEQSNLKAILKTLAEIKDDIDKGLYAQLDQNDVKRRRQDVSFLIEAAQLNEAKCSPQYFELVDAKLKREYENQINLKAFLISYRREQLNLCKTVLNSAAKQLSEAETQQLVDLKNEIILTKKDALEPTLSPTKVAKGLAAFIELKDNNLSLISDAKLVAIGCNKLLRGAEQLGDMKLFINSESSIQELDQQTLDWITTGRVCYFIGSNFDSVLDSAVRETFNKKPEEPADECSLLYEQLFTTTAARSTVRPEQVISFLDNLIQVCGARPDELSIERAKTGQLFKDFRLIEPPKCSRDKFDEFARYGSQIRQGTVLEGYMLDCRDELVKLCTSPIGEMASVLDTEVFQDMTIISANVVGGVALNPAHLKIKPEQVRTGLTRLITGLKSVVAKEQLAAVFYEKLHTACQATRLILGSLTDFYLNLANYSGVHLDETTQTWLTHYQVCNSITPMIVSDVVMNAENAGSKVYDRFTRRTMQSRQ